MTLAENLAAVEARIAAACSKAGRPRESVRLLPVSKTQPASVVLEAYEAGCRRFGENKVQEGLAKAEELGVPVLDEAGMLALLAGEKPA